MHGLKACRLCTLWLCVLFRDNGHCVRRKVGRRFGSISPWRAMHAVPCLSLHARPVPQHTHTPTLRQDVWTTSGEGNDVTPFGRTTLRLTHVNNVWRMEWRLRLLYVKQRCVWVKRVDALTQWTRRLTSDWDGRSFFTQCCCYYCVLQLPWSVVMVVGSQHAGVCVRARSRRTQQR